LLSNRFDFYQKNNETKILKKIETDSNRPDSIQFDSDFWTKTGSTWFGLVFSVWLSGLAQFFGLTLF
jgi:hypothetical protein